MPVLHQACSFRYLSAAAADICLLQLPIYTCPIYSCPIHSCLSGSCTKHAASGICLLQLPIYSCPIYSCLIGSCPIHSCLSGSCTFAGVTLLLYSSCYESLSCSTLAAGRSRREYACTSEVHSEVLLIRVALLLSSYCGSLTTRVRVHLRVHP